MKQLLPPALLALTLGACKKSTIESTESCRLVKVRLHGYGGSVSDSATLDYSNGRVSQVNLPSLRYTLTWNNDRITRRDFYFPAYTQPVYYDDITYDNNNLPLRFEHYEMASGSYRRMDSVLFEFNNGQLLRQTTYSRNGPSTPITIQQVSTFTYRGNNISHKQIDLYSGGQLSMTGGVDFVADTQPNFYNRIDPQFLFYNPDWMFNKLEETYFVWNANNLVQMTSSATSSPGYTLGWIPNAQGQLSEYRLQGTTATSFVYDCP